MMYTLYYHPSCVFSRIIKTLLQELKYDFRTEEKKFWERPQSLIDINPSGELPILINDNDGMIIGVYPITEYLMYKNQDWVLLDNIKINEIRRLVFWFNNKFFEEVTKYIINEKLLKLLMNYGSPNSKYLRAAKENLSQHMSYISQLLQKNEFIACDRITIADITAANHLMLLDYFNEIRWDKYEEIKNWFLIIKSRPSFQVILKERFNSLPPPKHYEKLDF